MLMANFHQVQPAEHTRRKFSTLGSFKNLQHLPTNGTSDAFPLGRLTCVPSALPTSHWSNRPRNRLPSPAPALSGRLQFGWCCFVLFSDLLLYLETFPEICDSSLSFSWQKGDRPDNDPLRHAASRQKKSSFDRSCWLVFVGRVFVCVLFCFVPTRPLVDSWVYLRLQAFRYKDCHYRYDERSNGPTKFPGYLFAGSCCFVVVLLFVSCWCFQVLRFLQFTACTLNM